MILTNIHNGTTYQNLETVVLGKKYIIVKVTGKFNYVNITAVKKCKGPGRDFENFDAACRAYKSPEMKTALLMAELNFNHA